MIRLNQIIYQEAQFLAEFDLNINQLERVVITGASGAGKSTLLNLIAGFIFPQSGEIKLNGTIVTTQRASARPISMMFQDNNVFTHLTVEQNIALGISPTLNITSSQRAMLIGMIERVGLTDYVDRLPTQLSGGQRQRIALARCLVQKRPILLLDEPFSALDPKLRLEMLQLVLSVCEEFNLTLLMVSHNQADTDFIATRNITLAQGHIIKDMSF